MTSETMLAVRTHDYGGPEVLQLEPAPRPEPQSDQVLIRVLAAGVNPADIAFRAGWLKEYVPLSFPWTPGLEGAGLVEAVGEGVTGFKVGQAVFGNISASNAEYAVAPASEIFAKPANLTFDQAASVSLGALTAWQAVIEVANVQSGQRVLVHGAAGGVGLYAAQLARWKGAHVIGTASALNAEFVRSLGVNEVIDYNATPFETVVQDVDAVIDTVGGEVLERSWKVLRPDGILVTVAARLTSESGQAHGVRSASVSRAASSHLATIAELLESKKLIPAVGALFPMAEVQKAHELSQTRHGRGRIILLTA